MTRSLLLCALALCVAGEARAQNVAPYLKWDNCAGEGGALAGNFDCDSNAGFERLVLSFVATGITRPVTGIEATIGIGGINFLGIVDTFGEPPTPLTPLGAWWDLRVGTPRGAALSVSATFTDPPFAGATNCTDYWAGQAVGGRSYAYPYLNDPGRGQIQATFAVPEGTVTPVPVDGREYYVMSATLTHLRTVGPDASPGCCTRVVAQVESLKLYFADGSSVPAQLGGYYDVSVSRQHESPACVPVPARNTTWGGVKSLYR